MDRLIIEAEQFESSGGDVGIDDVDSSVVLVMPTSGYSNAYALNSVREFQDFAIICRGGERYPINRFFASFLFEVVQTKVLGAGWSDGLPGVFDMSDVSFLELGNLISMSFYNEVCLRRLDLERYAAIAGQYMFWMPVRSVLCGLHADDVRQSEYVRHGSSSSDCDDMMTEDECMESRSVVRLVMPTSGFSSLYELNSNSVFQDFAISCKNGGIYRTNRFFACFLFEGVPKDMSDVSLPDLSEMISMLCSCELRLQVRDLKRYVDIANRYKFWKPVRLVLSRGLQVSISRELRDIEHESERFMSDLDAQRRAQLLFTRPRKPFPRRYYFTHDVVAEPVIGVYYLERRDHRPQVVLCAGSVTVSVESDLYVVCGGVVRVCMRRHLCEILDFDQVKAAVGYPIYTQLRTGTRLGPGMDQSDFIGRVYMCDLSAVDTRRFLEGIIIVALFLGSASGEEAFVWIDSRVALVRLTSLSCIKRGGGADDDDAKSRADVIFSAKPPPRAGAYSDTVVCTSANDLTVGEYYECPNQAFNGKEVTDTGLYFKKPVLYLGRGTDESVYVFAEKREALVPFRWMFPQHADGWGAVEDTDAVRIFRAERAQHPGW